MIFDSFTSHIDEDVRQNLKKKHKTTTAVIPLHISVNRAFKSKMRKRWEQWMTTSIHTFTQAGKMQKATYFEVCQWQAVPVTAIINGFRKAGILRDGTESDNSSDEDEVTNITTDKNLDAEMLALFHSDSEGEDITGFQGKDFE